MQENTEMKVKIAVAGTGYVGLSIATLLSQHHQVTAVDVVPEKLNSLINTSRLYKMNTSKSICVRNHSNSTLQPIPTAPIEMQISL